MSAPRTSRDPARREAGYALLMVVFLSTLVLFVAMTAAPNILTQGKREKEEELLWRGQQYARAIRFYHKKTNRFPQSVDDLTEPKNLIRFLRKPYKDPMNAEDGSWRIITVSPTGHLIGSMKQHNPIRLAGTSPTTPSKRSPASAKRPPRAGLEPEDAEGPRGMEPGATGESEGPGSSGMTPVSSFSQPLQGRVYGGNIIGVGSKAKQDSIRVYDGSTTYIEWEFIWDPAKDPTSTTQPVTPGVEPGKGRTTVPPRKGRFPPARK